MFDREALPARGRASVPGSGPADSSPPGSSPTPPSSPPPTDPRLSFRAGLAPAAVILLVACLNLHFFYSRGLTNLYGDALAHMEGARRLFDSLTPGFEELGSVWLPLYHLCVAPLAVNEHLWRTGLAGSLVSTAAFAVASWFVFRLGFALNRNLAAGWVALAGFLACANMLYVAATPLTEPLNLMWAVLVVWGLFRFQQSGRLLTLAGASLAVFFGSLTRYDGWYLIPFAALFVLLCRRRSWPDRLLDAAFFSLIAGLGPMLWLLHNLHQYGNPVEFYNGPYSAEAIYAHQLATTGFRYPTDGRYVLSIRYYLEAVKLVIGVGSMELAVLGFVAWAVEATERARRSAALLLLVPLVFYTQSMARSAVPIYVPTLAPYTYYNLRYALEMLPAMALFASFLLSARLKAGRRRWVAIVAIAILAVQFGVSARGGAMGIGIVKEAELNSPCHTQVSRALTALLQRDDKGGIILMAWGKNPCVLPALGIPYHRTLTEMNRRYWRLLRLGPAGWPRDLPPGSLAWIIRGDGDPVDELMRAYPGAFGEFTLTASFEFPGEERVRVYRRK